MTGRSWRHGPPADDLPYIGFAPLPTPEHHCPEGEVVDSGTSLWSLECGHCGRQWQRAYHYHSRREGNGWMVESFEPVERDGVRGLRRVTWRDAYPPCPQCGGRIVFEHAKRTAAEAPDGGNSKVLPFERGSEEAE